MNPETTPMNKSKARAQRKAAERDAARKDRIASGFDTAMKKEQELRASGSPDAQPIKSLGRAVVEHIHKENPTHNPFKSDTGLEWNDLEGFYQEVAHSVFDVLVGVERNNILVKKCGVDDPIFDKVVQTSRDDANRYTEMLVETRNTHKDKKGAVVVGEQPIYYDAFDRYQEIAYLHQVSSTQLGTEITTYLADIGIIVQRGAEAMTEQEKQDVIASLPTISQ